ncbi:MAG: hypothetical protein JSS27_01220 [Planctomycetes bacterium]|nr:hypothetical protein [Planctomycetota bacterium]
MSRLKNFLTLLVLLALSGVSVAAVWQAARFEQRDTTADDREAFGEWLRTAPADNVPLEVNRRWIRQLHRDFRAGYDWRAVYRDLPVDEQQHMVINLSRLATLWLQDKVDRYYRERGRGREQYLRREFEDLLIWKPILDAASNTDDSDLWQLVFERTRSDVASRDPDAKRKLETFFTVIQRHRLEQMMRTLVPGRDRPGR